MPFDKTAIQVSIRRFLDPIAGGILSLGISPNALTVLGLILSILAGILIAQGDTLLAALLLFLGGVCDILDGSMARRSGKSSPRGAFLDSTLDRLAEIAVFIGLIILYRDRIVLQTITGLALTGSLMTSYARARAEGLNIDCKVGLLERPERLVLLIVGLVMASLRLFNVGLLELVVLVLALLTYYTTFQRMIHVLKRAPSAALASVQTEDPGPAPTESLRGEEPGAGVATDDRPGGSAASPLVQAREPDGNPGDEGGIRPASGPQP